MGDILVRIAGAIFSIRDIRTKKESFELLEALAKNNLIHIDEKDQSLAKRLVEDNFVRRNPLDLEQHICDYVAFCQDPEETIGEIRDLVLKHGSADQAQYLDSERGNSWMKSLVFCHFQERNRPQKK